MALRGDRVSPADWRRVMVGRLRARVLVLVWMLFLGGCVTNSPANDLKSAQGTGLPLVAGSGTLEVVVAATGICRLDADDLTQAGLDASALTSRNVRLSVEGRLVPIWLDPARHNIYFFGQAFRDRYRAEAVYLLQWGANSGVFMPEVAVAAGHTGESDTVVISRRFETNRLYIPRAAGEVFEPWFWERLSPGSATEVSFPVPDVSAGAAELRLGLWGSTADAVVSPDHAVELNLNGRRLGSVEWDGMTSVSQSFQLPAGLLRRGENALELVVSTGTGSAADLSYLDWIEVDLPVAAELRGEVLQFRAPGEPFWLPGADLMFDVTDPAAPIRLMVSTVAGKPDETAPGPRSLVALKAGTGLTPLQVTPRRQSEWSSPGNQADYVILVPSALAASLGPLAAARREQGLEVAVVVLEDIAGEFGLASSTPLAINSFLRFTHEQWQQPQPRYLLLVGEATYDYRDYLGLKAPNTVATMLVPVAHGGETVSDSRMADVDGDGKPDLAVGRWPVTTAAQVRALVRRTLAYESATRVSTRSLFVADGSEAYFAGGLDRLIEAAGLNNGAVRLYGAVGDQTVQSWNEGAWLVTYFGHGGLGTWGKVGAFSVDKIKELRSAGNPPVVVHLTCLSGLFAHPSTSSLAEEMLWSDRGPVAVIGGTSLTLPDDQLPFAEALLSSIANIDVHAIGDALLIAQQSVAGDQSGGQEISDTFQLLGDPALRIARPR